MVGDHPRNTGPMLSSPRCGAKTRSGTPCRSPAVRGKKRCRMHGGAKGSGAPIGNQNALRHGRYARKFIHTKTHTKEQHARLSAEEQKSLQRLIREAEDFLDKIK